MLGDRIAHLRREKGYTQAQLAQLLHISASALGMYEQGRRMPGAETLVELSARLQVSLDYHLQVLYPFQKQHWQLFDVLLIVILLEIYQVSLRLALTITFPLVEGIYYNSFITSLTKTLNLSLATLAACITSS